MNCKIENCSEIIKNEHLGICDFHLYFYLKVLASEHERLKTVSAALNMAADVSSELKQRRGKYTDCVVFDRYTHSTDEQVAFLEECLKVMEGEIKPNIFAKIFL